MRGFKERETGRAMPKYQGHDIRRCALVSCGSRGEYYLVADGVCTCPSKRKLLFADKELTALVLASSNYTHSTREFDQAQASAARKLGNERRRRAQVEKARNGAKK